MYFSTIFFIIHEPTIGQIRDMRVTPLLIVVKTFLQLYIILTQPSTKYEYNLCGEAMTLIFWAVNLFSGTIVTFHASVE